MSSPKTPEDIAVERTSVPAPSFAAGTSGTSERKPYEKPTLQRLGSVKDLTFATRMTPFSDGGGRRSM